MNEEQSAMMMRLQQLGLTINDLTIYLDTHPFDTFAMERLTMSATEYGDLADRYAELYGPLTVMQAGVNSGGWQWAMQDFPWNY